MTMVPLLNALYNFHWVVPGEAARSAQPYLGMWQRFLTANRIKAVVNLRGRHPEWHWWRAETRICKANGIAHIDAMINSRKLPNRAWLVGLLDAFDAAPRPVLIKCSGGQDRTSFASALYLIDSRGWGAFDAAKAQYARFPYLHFPRRNQRWLRLFLDFAREESRGTPLGVWVRENYDGMRFQAWLERGGHGKSFRNRRPE
jgi:protein tyrosine/serine phosphatase